MLKYFLFTGHRRLEAAWVDGVRWLDGVSQMIHS